MKTRLPRLLLVLLAGASAALAAEDRIIISDPGARSGNPGSGATRDAAAGSAENNAQAGNTRREYPPESGLRSPDDMGSTAREHERFFTRLARLNERELLLSRQAAERATNPQVRAYATEMAREHTSATEELSRLSTRKGVTIQRMSAEKVADLQQDWAAKSGREHDEDYLEAMIDAHEDTLDLLEKGAGSKDAEVAAFASKMRPQIQTHLQRARALKKSLE